MTDVEDTPPTVERLLALLDVERLDRDLYRSPDVASHHPKGMRLFGGQVAAQALRAATLSVDVDHHPHSLHGYFLRVGDASKPIIYDVDCIRDGKSFTTRRVVAIPGLRPGCCRSRRRRRIARGRPRPAPLPFRRPCNWRG